MSKRREQMGAFHYIMRRADHRQRLLLEERGRRKEERFKRILRDDEFSFDAERTVAHT